MSPRIAAFAKAGPPPSPTFTAEKCYGIAKAGANDCASTGNNSCAGTSRLDADPASWVCVPAGYCERIVRGTFSAAHCAGELQKWSNMQIADNQLISLDRLAAPAPS